MLLALRDQDKLWEGMERGRTEGRIEGRTEGIFLSIKNLMESMDWSAEQAMECLKIPEAEREKYIKELEEDNL